MFLIMSYFMYHSEGITQDAKEHIDDNEEHH